MKKIIISVVITLGFCLSLPALAAITGFQSGGDFNIVGHFLQNNVQIIPNTPTATSTYKIAPDGVPVFRADATSTIWSLGVGNATSTLKTWRKMIKTAQLTELSCAISAPLTSGITFKLWYSVDISGWSASTTIGTYNCTASTTPQYSALTSQIAQGNYLIMEASTASTSQISNMTVDIGGYFPNN